MRLSAIVILLVIIFSGRCCFGEEAFAETHLKGAITNGQGAVCFSDGSKYVGQFKGGIIHGRGTIDFSDGSKYSGGFLAGEMNGQGTMTFPDGSKYVGQFKNGKIHGKGKLSFPDGSMYEGEVRGDKYHGEGTWFSPYGVGYEGQFKDGKFDGQGVYSLPDGSRYVGMFRDDHFHGHGAWGKGKKSGGISSAEQLRWKETGSDKPVGNTDIMNEPFAEMEERGSDTILRHEESVPQNVEQELGSEVHREDYSQSDENMPADNNIQEKEGDSIVAGEISSQETAGISTSCGKDSEMSNTGSIADQGQMAGVPDAYASSQLGFSVQVGAFLSRNNAERLTALLIDKGYSASILPMLDCINRPWYTVRIGSYSSLPEARERAITFTEKEQMMATVRPVDSL